MKKFISSLFACALSFVMLTFIACAPATSDTTYEGNYNEVDAQTLYNATRGVNTTFNIEPEEGKKVGAEFSLYGEYKTETNEYTSIEKESIVGQMTVESVRTDGGIEKVLRVSCASTSANETVIDGEKSSISTTEFLYCNNEGYYVRVLQNSSMDGKTNKYDLKYKITYSEFMEKFSDVMDKLEADTSTPPLESDFITFINNLKSVSGYKFSMATDENGFKIKAEADKDKYADKVIEDEELVGFDVTVKEMGLCFVFDNDKNIVASKTAMSIKKSSPYGILTTVNRMDVRAYVGAISLPSDLNTYIDTTLVNP